MLPTSFIGLVIVSSILPLLGTLFFVVAISSNDWESVSFNYDEITSNRTNMIHASPTDVIDTMFDHNGDRVGLLITRVNQTDSYWCIYNFKAGIWYLCDLMTDKSRIDSRCDLFDRVKENNQCFNYITDYAANRKNIVSYGEFVIKMQNNIISCVIVVLLCVAASIMIGTAALVAKIVPAAMVTGVLYLTAGLFVFFANCIEFIKVNKIRSHEAFCYPVVAFGTEVCVPMYINVEAGWPSTLSWMSSVFFVFACAFWLYLTRSMRIETTKNML